jgi:hypothetical protein
LGHGFSSVSLSLLMDRPELTVNPVCITFISDSFSAAVSEHL